MKRDPFRLRATAAIAAVIAPPELQQAARTMLAVRTFDAPAESNIAEVMGRQQRAAARLAQEAANEVATLRAKVAVLQREVQEISDALSAHERAPVEVSPPSVH